MYRIGKLIGEQLGNGREMELLHYVYKHPSIGEFRGSPFKVIKAIDEFASKKYLMNVGPRKGQLVCNLIATLRPKVMVELGGYVGYSAVLFGDALRKAGGNCYYSLECNPEYAAISGSLVDLAGLKDIVKIEVGTSDSTLKRLHAGGRLETIDLLFIDHYKPAYKHDLLLCEELRLVKPGSTVAADNVIHPGAPDYLAYVRSSVEDKRITAAGGGTGWTEHPSNDNWYLRTEQRPRELLKTTVRGNPNLEYDTELIMSFEPNGIPVYALSFM